MTYTINGKEYSEFDINKRCAELMGVAVEHITDTTIFTANAVFINPIDEYIKYDPCNNWNDAGPIIEKCWDELFSAYGFVTKWESLIKKHNCSKLVAACICFIEINPPPEKGQ